MTPEMRFSAKIEFVGSIVEKRSERKPQIFGFEDLQYADETSIAILKRLFEETTLSRVILIASSRIESEILTKDFWLQDINKYSVQIIDLQPLTSSESYQVANSSSLTNERILRQCVERAEGNPLFLDQLLRNADDNLEQGSIPGSIESMMIARVDRIPVRERKALKVASVYGQWFTLEMVNHLLDTSNILFNAALASHLIRSENSGFIFTNSMLQEAIYSSYLSKQKKELHDHAAVWYSGKDLILEAQHLDRAENPKASEAYLRASENCRKRFDFSNGLLLVERGIELAQEELEKYQLICLQAFMTREVGKPQHAIKLYNDAIEIINDKEHHCEAWVGIAASNRWMGRGEESAEILNKTERIAKSKGLQLRLAQVS
jgi:hypothetical protein